MTRLEPIAMYVEETVVGPVAGGYEKDEKKDGAVDAWSIEKVRQEKERNDEPAE